MFVRRRFVYVQLPIKKRYGYHRNGSIIDPHRYIGFLMPKGNWLKLQRNPEDPDPTWIVGHGRNHTSWGITFDRRKPY